MSATTSNNILDEILYDQNIRIAIYGGLYFCLFLFVGIFSAIKTYQTEKAKLLKRRRAFQKRPGSYRTMPAPIELTETEIITIKQRKAKKKKIAIKTSKSIELTTKSTNITQEEEENKYESNTIIHKITVEEYDHNATNIDSIDSRKTTMEKQPEYGLESIDSPTFESEKPPTTHPLPSHPITLSPTSRNEQDIGFEEEEEQKTAIKPPKIVAVPINGIKLSIPNGGDASCKDNDYETSITTEISVNEADSSHSNLPPTGRSGLSEDDDDDDYHSKYSYFDDEDEDTTTSGGSKKPIKNKNTCCCNDFWYILCKTDFRKNWPKNTWQARAIYGAVIVYISDYITDINILILWCIEGWNQYKYGITPKNGLNMILMAIACLSVLLSHKIITTIAVIKATVPKDLQREDGKKPPCHRTSYFLGLLQFFDLYIFVEVYLSHKIGQKTDRLRWLSNLESVFEASPQVILQLVYIMQSVEKTDNNSTIVMLGLFFSVLKLGNTAINNDAVHVTSESNKVMQYKFWLRSFFRVTELTARQFMFVLMWLVIGEKFLLMVLGINLIHNVFLYYGGCLSRQIINVVGHIVSLAQLSYTIVEGQPIKFFLRGKLYEDDPDDTRSKLQIAYSIFIKDYNLAKNNKAERRRYQGRKKAVPRRNNNKHKANGNDLPSPSGPSTVTPILGGPSGKTTNSSFSGLTQALSTKWVAPLSPTDNDMTEIDETSFPPDSPQEIDGLRLAMDMEPSSAASASDLELVPHHNNNNNATSDNFINRAKNKYKNKNKNKKRKKESSPNMVPENSISNNNKDRNHKNIGRLQLNTVNENGGWNDNDNNNNNDNKEKKLQLNEIEKYQTSIGEMNGIYSYFTWIHSLMIGYLNIYLSSQRPQQIMMIQRSICGLFWLLIIGLHGGLEILHKNGDSSYWRTEYHLFIPFGRISILLMYGISILFQFLGLIFFWLMMENSIILTVKKKEEIQFRSIYDAIYYGRLDAIINQFDKRRDLISLSPEGKSPLYYAAELHQIDIAEWLISKKHSHSKIIDINIGANQDRTPLYIACRVGCYDIVCMLLDCSSCDYNKANALGRTPLYAACREGHYQIVCELLKQALIDINYLTNHRSSALAAACQHGYIDIVYELLLKPEIEINELNESNYTPIFIAALGTHTEIVRILLNRQEIDIDRGAKNDETLFYVSCERGMHEIVQILIDRDDYNVDINKANSRNYTPLYIAACFGHSKIIEILMNIDKSTLNQCDNIGRTPFFVACRKGNKCAVFKLLQYDNIDIHKRDQDELTPFAASCQGGSVEVVEKLMKLVDRSEIIGVDRMKRTPFFMACREGQTAVVERLMLEDNIIDINQPDKLSRTPLMVCVKRGHSQCVATLCKNQKIDINEPDHQGRSPLFIAAKQGASHCNVIKSLMRRTDLSINHKANDGKTALHIACELGHSSIVMLLLDHTDIDVNEPDDYGTSPLAIADKKLDNNVYMRMVMISMRD